MTPDEIEKLIPDEVVESTAEAICDVEFWPGMWATLDRDSDECVTYRKAAIAAIAAGIAAWPGATLMPEVEAAGERLPSVLVFPLPRADQKEGE